MNKGFFGGDIKVKKLSETAKLPEVQTKGSAGGDLYADIDKDLTVYAGQIVKIPVNIAMEIPEGYVGMVFARSSLATKRDLSLVNNVAIIDSDYRGNLIVPIKNKGDNIQIIHAHERIAQLVLVPYLLPNYVEVDDLNETERGTGGFGSTGIN